MSSSLSYRPDIDGLRALALIPILFFHVGIDITPGGFIGVDMFFVISGYLIIAIIQKQMDAGTFTMTDFMSRRIRRIFPAAFVLLVCTLLAGWFLLSPHDYAELGRSARYNALFSANIYFWQSTGYFDTAENMKPLLHTWSLAVEEQFYLLLPLFLMLIKPLSVPVRLSIIALVGLASFLASWWQVNRDIDTAYYLLHTRAWEFFVGGLLAYAPTRMNRNPVIANVVGGSGLVALIVMFLTYHHPPAMVFPGPAALPPTLATAAIIWAGPYTWSSRFLALRPVVFAGRISYSWYLWHWPIIVFANYWYGDSLGVPEKLLLLLAGLAMGFLSWLCVEEPLRRKQILATNKPLFITAIGCTLMIVVVAQQIRVNEGFPDRLPKAAQQYESARHRDKSAKRCENVSADDVRAGKFCKLGPATEQPALVSWGDSHSGALLPLYETFANEQRISLWHSSMIACSPLTNADNSHKQHCIDYNLSMLEFVRDHHIPHVLLASRWPTFLYGENGNDGQVLKHPANVNPEAYYQQLLENLVTSIRNAGAEVWIVKQVPTHPFEPPKHLAMLAMQGKPTTGLGRSHSEHLEMNRVVNAFIDEIARKDAGVHVLDATDLLCQAGGICRTELDGTSLYRDDNHLSPTGAHHIRAMLQPLATYLAGKASDETGTQQ